MNKHALSKISLVILMSLLSGCATKGSDVLSACPQVKMYDETFNERLAREVEILPPDSVVFEALRDCFVLRQQVKVCQ